MKQNSKIIRNILCQTLESSKLSINLGRVWDWKERRGGILFMNALSLENSDRDHLE